ncbi:unnamed protein product [Paramecium pentaurelia]|uniref:Uncharacterized protein n=1 Tax=Paramecium pentaurelia TaxID=43138 RepID=A0A8S1U970_9CILI|nr:unnamed protein product [Paramecium pentaurelia]
MNSKNYSQTYSQCYSEETEEKVQSLSNMEIRWLNLLKRVSGDDLEMLRIQLEKQKQSLKDIEKGIEQQIIEEI